MNASGGGGRLNTIETARNPRFSTRKRKIRANSDFCNVYPCVYCDCVCATYDLVVEHILAQHAADNIRQEDISGQKNVSVEKNRVKSHDDSALLDKSGLNFGIKKLEVKLKKLSYAIPERDSVARPETSRQGKRKATESENYSQFFPCNQCGVVWSTFELLAKHVELKNANDSVGVRSEPSESRCTIVYGDLENNPTGPLRQPKQKRVERKKAKVYDQLNAMKRLSISVKPIEDLINVDTNVKIELNQDVFYGANSITKEDQLIHLMKPGKNVIKPRLPEKRVQKRMKNVPNKPNAGLSQSNSLCYGYNVKPRSKQPRHEPAVPEMQIGIDEEEDMFDGSIVEEEQPVMGQPRKKPSQTRVRKPRVQQARPIQNPAHKPMHPKHIQMLQINLNEDLSQTIAEDKRSMEVNPGEKSKRAKTIKKPMYRPHTSKLSRQIEIENKAASDVREIKKRRRKVIQIAKQQQRRQLLQQQCRKLLRPKQNEQIDVEKDGNENSYNDEEQRIKVDPKINLNLVYVMMKRLHNSKPPKSQKKRRICKKKNNDKATMAEVDTSIKSKPAKKSKQAELRQKILCRPIAPKLSNCSKISKKVDNTSSDHHGILGQCEVEQQQIQPQQQTFPPQQMQPQKQQSQIFPHQHIQQQTTQPPQQTIVLQQMQPQLQRQIFPVQHIQQQNIVPQQQIQPQIQQQHIVPLQNIQQQTIQPPQPTIPLQQQMLPPSSQAIECNEVMAVRYGCNECTSSWSTPGSLNIHKRIKHSRSG